MRTPLAVAALLLAGCQATDADDAGPHALFDLDDPSLFASPWPSDVRTREDGTLILDTFPNPHDVKLLNDYLAVGKEQVGFGANSGIYVALDGPIDAERMPTAAGSLEDDSPVLLVNIDPTSPHWGERYPVQWRFFETPTSYHPGNFLAVAPVFGFPLRPATQHALILTTELVSPTDAFQAVWDDDDPHHETFADLDDTLFFLGLHPDEVGVATTFTTADPLSEMANLAKFVRHNIGPTTFAPLEHRLDLDEARGFRTHYMSPYFTHGERPYTTEGGGFRFDESGKPILAGWDDMRLWVCTPLDVSDPPPNGWPVVIYQHGTGGDYDGYCNSTSDLEVGNRLARVPVIGLGIDQPLHGTRSDGQTASDLAHFNVVNPEGARSNFRQGALDAIYLARSLKQNPPTFETPDGSVKIPVDPDNVLFMGHSQGGLTGALAAPFIGEDVRAMVLSGSGGVLAVTIVDRDDIIDFSEMVHTLLQFQPTEEVEELHPTLTLVQTLVDVTDPVNYAPYWFSERGWWEGHTPTNILMTSGTLDAATPYRTAEAMAAAARIPALDPAASDNQALLLRGIQPAAPPLQDNAVAFDGSPVTTGFSQWTNGDHYVVFRYDAAADMYAHYLSTATRGTPEIVLER